MCYAVHTLKSAWTYPIEWMCLSASRSCALNATTCFICTPGAVCLPSFDPASAAVCLDLFEADEEEEEVLLQTALWRGGGME